MHKYMVVIDEDGEAWVRDLRTWEMITVRTFMSREGSSLGLTAMLPDVPRDHTCKPRDDPRFKTTCRECGRIMH
jgi:hypothetical protein